MTTTREQRSWILYDVANSAFALIVMTTFFPIFFKEVIATSLTAAYSTAMIGYANTAAALIVALAAPIIGTFADFQGFKRKFFSAFIILGVLATAGLFLIMPGMIFPSLIVFVLAIMGFSLANVIYDSFLIDVADNDRMDWVSSLGVAFGYIGSVIPFLACIGLLFFSDGFGFATQNDAIRITFLITAVWWGFFSVPALKKLRQKYAAPRTDDMLSLGFKKVFQLFRHLYADKQVFFFLLAYFFYIDGVSTIIKMASTFGLDVGISPMELVLVILAVQIVAFPFAVLYGKLAARFGTLRMIYVALFIYIGISIYALFLKSTIHFWILALLIASSQGGIQALSRSFFGRLAPKESSGEYYGLFNVVGKFSAVLGPTLFGISTQVTGDSRFGVLSLIVLFIIGGLLLFKVKGVETVGAAA